MIDFSSILEVYKSTPVLHVQHFDAILHTWKKQRKKEIIDVKMMNILDFEILFALIQKRKKLQYVLTLCQSLMLIWMHM